MKAIIAIVFTLVLFSGYSQQSSAGETMPTKGCTANTPVRKFMKDLKSNSLTIYTIGGLKPPNHKVDEEFQTKFRITYHDFGCIAPLTIDFFEEYNLLVFHYLTKQHGNSWEKDIKDNAMGFYKWKEAK